MKFSVEYLIRFQHCDPAGIVFYPRYYEMFNQVVEDWFAQALGWSFASLEARDEGIPLVHAEADFLASSQIGDYVTFELVLRRIGRKSFTVEITGTRGEEVRLRATLVLAYANISNGLRAISIPPELRERMLPYLEN